FALPGAVDRLRAARERTEEPHAVVLAATDPANPYGAALSWPERPEGRKPMRTAGALVVLVDGRIAGWLGRGEEQLLTFVADEADAEPTRKALATALAAEVGPDRRTTLFTRTCACRGSGTSTDRVSAGGSRRRRRALSSARTNTSRRAKRRPSSSS